MIHGDHTHETAAQARACWEANRRPAAAPAAKPAAQMDLGPTAPAKPAWKVRNDLAAQLPDPKKGHLRFAVRLADGVLRFYDLRRPKQGRYVGRVYLDQVVGGLGNGVAYPVRDQAAVEVLSALLVDVPTGLAAYGAEIKRCACCNSLLTDTLSRTRGIGPDCWALYGFDSQQPTAA